MAKKRSEAEIIFKATDSGMKDTLKGITSEMTKNRAEQKLEQAQLQLTGSETEKLESKLGSLQKQYDLQGQKIETTSQRLENAKKYYGENSTEVQKLEKELINQQTAQQRLSNDITKTSQTLSTAKGETKSYSSTMNGLDDEQKKVQASAELAESEYKKWQSTFGDTASESEKFAKAQELVGKQSDFAQQKIDIMERQLEATKQEFGENSTEAMQMQAKLNDAEREFTELGNAAEKASQNTSLDDVGKKLDLNNLQNAAEQMSQIGEKLVDVGKASLESFNTVDEGLDTIITKTGASSKQMSGYEQIYKKLGSTMPVELSKVGEAIGEVNTQLGFQGDELESASKQAIQFSEINGQDVTSSVVSAKQALSAYSLENKDFGMVLDTVTKVAQDTGQSTQDLFDKAVEGAPQIKALGLSFQDGVTLMGNFEKAGVDSGAALSSLSKASAVYAKDGKTLKEGLSETVEKIKNASSETDALNAASEVFGTKGAVRMVDAIKRGTFNLDEFGKTSEDTSGKVAKTYEDTLDPIDQLTVSQNNATMALADFGAALAETLAPMLKSATQLIKGLSKWFSSLSPGIKQMIVVIGGLSAAFMMLSPFIVSMITIFTTLGGLFAEGGALAAVGTFFTGTLLPAIPIIAAVVAAVVAVIAIIKNWGAITDFLSEVWTDFTGWLSDLWSGITETASSIWGSVTEAIKGVWSSFTTWWSELWNGITSTVSNIWNAFATWITGVWQGFIETVAPIWNTIVAVFQVVFMTIQSVIQGVWLVISSWLQAIWQTIVQLTEPIWRPIADFFVNLWNTISTTVTNVWNAISTFLSTTWSAITEIAKSIWNPIASFFTGIWRTIDSAAKSVWNALSSFFSSTWNKIKSVASSVWNAVASTLSGVWNGIKSTASNIFNGLAQAVSNIWNGIKNTTSNIWNGIKSAIGNVVNGIKSSVSNVFNGLKSSVSNIFNGIKNAMTGPVEAAKNTISNIIDRIKSFFTGIRLRLPKIDMPPLPHFRLSGSFSLKPPSVPHLNVNWYKKGSVFNSPNVIGVGEAGPEAVLPLNDRVLGTIAQMIAKNSPSQAGSGSQVVQNEFKIEINGNVDSEVTARRMVDDIMERITDKYNNQNSAFS